MPFRRRYLGRSRPLLCTRLCPSNLPMTGSPRLLPAPVAAKVCLRSCNRIPKAKAKRAIAETLEVAADHQLQGLRQKDSQRDRVRSAGDVGRLIARLEELAQALAKLPPVSKKKLNAIVVEYTAQFFDTETFSPLICALADALPELGPKRRAQDVLNTIYRPVAGIVRTSPPELIELWESISAETRRQVEKEVRALAAKRSAVEFFRKLIRGN